MDEAVKILIVILASVLSIFLVLLIILTVKIVQIIGHIKRLTEKAEQMVDKAEAVTEFFERTAPQVAIGRLVSNIADSVFHHKKSSKRKG